MAENGLIKVDYAEEMKKSYIDYAMSVIVSRALPDIRDGLKPVQRRIIYTMGNLGVTKDKPYKKSARIVGDVLGKYHPHSDASVYDAMVKLAQDFNMNYPLLDGHGNFGSVDGDSAAAMRYTEVRLEKIAEEFLEDIDKNTVSFNNNFDGTLKEPNVLPCKIPNLLVNGTSGIAVGMSTNIPPHNLGEVIDGVLAYINNKDITIKKLMKYIKGPDFPTGGIVSNKKELEKIYSTGTGNVKIRANIKVEDAGYGKTNLVVTEIPYTFSGNKERLIDNIISKIEDKTFTEITDVRDETSKEGIRLVLEVKKGVDIDNLVIKLYDKTKLEDTFYVNLLALVDGKPKVLNLKAMIEEYVDFQREINKNKFEFLLKKKQTEKEILEGLVKATDIIDLIIDILRGSKDIKSAKQCLMFGDISNVKLRFKKDKEQAQKLNFTEKQTNAILNMKLQNLIKLELDKVKKDLKEVEEEINNYESILNNNSEMREYIKKYLLEIKNIYNKNRKTKIKDIKNKEYIEKIEEETLYILIDKFYYIKAIDEQSYSKIKEETLNEYRACIPIKNTDDIVLFTDKGDFYQVSAMDIPRGKINSKGVLIDVLLKMNGRPSIVFIDTKTNIIEEQLLFLTEKGYGKIVNSEEFKTNRRTIRAVKLNKGDKLSFVKIVSKEKYFKQQTNKGRSIKIEIKDFPNFGRNAKGNRIVKLKEKEKIKNNFI